MNLLFLLPFCLQAIAITFDEFYFHWKRGLPKWERIGHPIDTFSLLLCLLFTLFFSLSSHTLIFYIILAALSCLCVTKDEWIHKEHCPGTEQWLHALLFLNHPLVLIVLALMWKQQPLYLPFLCFQTVFVFFFFLYQLIYWNFIWREDAKEN